MTDGIDIKTVVINSVDNRKKYRKATDADTDPSCLIYGEHTIRLVNMRLARIWNAIEGCSFLNRKCPFWASHHYSNAEFEDYIKSLKD